MSANEYHIAAIITRDAEAVSAALTAGADPGHGTVGKTGYVYHDEVPVLVLAAWTGKPRSWPHFSTPG